MKVYRFVASHFCEKALWALDRKGVRYETVDLLPGLHFVTAKRLRLRKTSLPILVDGDRRLQGSSAIIDHLEARLPQPSLAPSEGDVLELERYLDLEVGEMLQLVLYDALLDEPEECVRFLNEGGPVYGRWLYTLSWPLTKRTTVSLYGVTPEACRQAKQRFAAAVERLDNIVASRRYLLGNRFSRVDITAAALMALLVRPPEHELGDEGVLAPLRPFAEKFADSPTWRWVRRMYAEERHR